MLTPEQINNLPPDTKKEYLKAALLLDEKKKDQAIRNDFLEFVIKVPDLNAKEDLTLISILFSFAS